MRSKTVTRPPALTAGSRIALVAPAGPLLNPDDIRRAEELVSALGWTPTTGRHAGALHHYFAGSDEERLADLNEALASDAVDGVWCIRGGYGVTRILHGIDYAGFRAHPKVVLGFSDVTALLLALLAKCGIVAYHGPVARRPLTKFSRAALERVVQWGGEPLSLPRRTAHGDDLVPTEGRVVSIRGGTVEGSLVGGNLSLVQALVGTPYLPPLDGAVLFLEDVGEDVYRIDRMLSHLRLAGLLEGVAGVMLGQFTELRERSTDGAVGLERVFREYFEPLGIPVAMGLPIGHVDDQWTLPLGARARFDATAGTLELIDPA